MTGRQGANGCSSKYSGALREERYYAFRKEGRYSLRPRCVDEIGARERGGRRTRRGHKSNGASVSTCESGAAVTQPRARLFFLSRSLSNGGRASARFHLAARNLSPSDRPAGTRRAPRRFCIDTGHARKSSPRKTKAGRRPPGTGGEKREIFHRL